jgi:hypothetical protein
VSDETKVSNEAVRSYIVEYDKHGALIARDDEIAAICRELLANRQAIAALKPYLRHMAMCGKNLYPAPCDCGLDALLSGATK